MEGLWGAEVLEVFYECCSWRWIGKDCVLVVQYVWIELLG